MAEHFSDLTVFAFLMIISKTFVEDLYPLASRMQGIFSLKADL